MPSSISNSDGLEKRATAADRPGVAQPVPSRPVPLQRWWSLLILVSVITVVLTLLWEWHARELQLLPGDLGDGGSAWAEQRRRIDSEDIAVAIVGDSRILFGTDLGRFAALTGRKPLQLAIRATNARPFLENLAADPKFKGLAIVGITDVSYFRKRIGPGAEALERFRFESPAQRASFVLYRALSRVIGFLDDDYRLSKLVFRLDPNLRRGVEGPYDDVWKVMSVTDDRQSWLWPRVETDPRIRAHARYAWHAFAGPAVPQDLIDDTIAATRRAVETIRAHGGDVVFVRPPSGSEARRNEDSRLPRARGWDELLRVAAVRGLHADDEPSFQGLEIPEGSHLSRACATVFTDAYVRRLAALSDRIRLTADAPRALTASDCTGS